MSRRKQSNPKPLLKDLNSQTEHLIGSEYTTITTTTVGLDAAPCSPSNSEKSQPQKKRFKRDYSPINKPIDSTETPTQPNESNSSLKNSNVDSSHSSTNVSSSILINGKRYYPLIFSCENCGLRYSDESTLNIHKQNYCSKRMLSPRSPKCSSNCSSSRSSSGSPNRILSDSSSTNENYPKKEQHVQMVKSVVYQCNNCLFQTDKKSLMNRHSRVHLADKRKTMEDCVNESNELTKKSIKIEQQDPQRLKPSNNEESQKSYCNDCDIQFSSVSTYQHHRNNYCQKYKTIEAVVSVDQSNTTKNDEKKVSQRSNEETKHSKKSLNPLRMADMVYFPMFKLNEQETPSASNYANLKNENMVLKQFLQSNTKLIQQMNSMQMRQSKIPIDLSIKDNDKKQRQLQNQLSVINMHMMSNIMPNIKFPLIKTQPTPPTPPPAPAINKHETNVQNKIYHCRNCQQLFFNLKVFEQHICKSSPIIPIEQNLLKHPLVKKTLIETYKTDSTTFFFICTTCGYRGNTARGVKQHGKLHLQQAEQFAVINITTESNEPILVYNSNEDKELQIQFQQQQQQQQPVVKEEDKVIKEDTKETTVPFSKKARILDLHYNQQKKLLEKTECEQSQSYCLKCNIQFKQINNYLAHKRLYCK